VTKKKSKFIFIDGVVEVLKRQAAALIIQDAREILGNFFKNMEQIKH